MQRAKPRRNLAPDRRVRLNRHKELYETAGYALDALRVRLVHQVAGQPGAVTAFNVDIFDLAFLAGIQFATLARPYADALLKQDVANRAGERSLSPEQQFDYDSRVMAGYLAAAIKTFNATHLGQRLLEERGGQDQTQQIQMEAARAIRAAAGGLRGGLPAVQEGSGPAEGTGGKQIPP